MSWLVVSSTFLASGVEWVEALTIVLAVGVVRGWRSAWAGTAAAAALLLGVAALFGSTVHSFPIGAARAIVGVFLLLFGLKWLRKAILRSSGLKALHDEAAAFEETREHLGGGAVAGGRLDWVGTTTAFNGVLLEGIEVIFIVVALGGLRSVGAASVGALVALAVVLAAGIALRAPLTRVPENTLKYVVGVMLTSFGTFFAGEGIGIAWWHGDLSVLFLIAGYGLASLALVSLLRSPPGVPAGNALRILRAIASEVWSLFVDDGALAIVAVAVVLGTSVFVERLGHASLAGLLLAVGVVAAIAVSLAGKLTRRVSLAEEDE